MGIVRNSYPRTISYLFILIILPAFWGCASWNSILNPFRKSEYEIFIEQQRQKKEALAAAEEKASKKAPDLTVKEYEAMGDNFLRQGDIERAYIQYYKALQVEPKRSDILYKTGSIFMKKGLPDEAIKDFQQILNDDPNNALAYEGMGKAFLQKGNMIEAENNFSKAIKLNDGLWQAHNFLGIIYDRQGHFEAAIGEYKSAIAIKPKESIVLNNLGMSYYLKKDYERAVNAFTEALKIEGTNRKVNNNLALALSKLSRYQDAFELFKKGGNEATAYNNIGYIYMTEGKQEKAIEAFEKAVEINPRFYVRAHENMKEARAAADIKSQEKNIEPEDIPKQMPQSGTVKKDVPEPEWKEPFQKSCPNCHIVVAGETLSSIAKKYNMTLENLEKLNGISSEKILKAGTKLRLF